jgi:hypothetical protein
MRNEGKIYLVLLALAYVAFNIGMFIFSAQHVINNLGPDKGSLDPIHFTGMIVYTLCSIAAIVFVTFRMKDK